MKRLHAIMLGAGLIALSALIYLVEYGLFGDARQIWIYIYLFSLAVRANPFDPQPNVEIRPATE
jgi:hypothetical protein